MDFFGSNDSKNALTAAIDKATDPMLMHTDWGLNLEICDLINQSPEGALGAVRALKRKLKGDVKVVNLALQLTDACVKNCKTAHLGPPE